MLDWIDKNEQEFTQLKICKYNGYIEIVNHRGHSLAKFKFREPQFNDLCLVRFDASHEPIKLFYKRLNGQGCEVFSESISIDHYPELYSKYYEVLTTAEDIGL